MESHLCLKARAQAIMKQLNETWEQIDQNSLALSTFKFLSEQEESAIPRRMEVCKLNFNQSFYWLI